MKLGLRFFAIVIFGAYMVSLLEKWGTSFFPVTEYSLLNVF